MKIKRRTAVLLKVWLIGILVVALVGVCSYIYFKTPALTIYSYKLEGVPDLYKDRINTSLHAVESQVRYGFLPSNRIVGYRASAIRFAVVDILPNTRTVDVFPVGLHTLRVNVTSYTPLFKFDETRGITKDGIIYTEFRDMSSLPILFIASSTTHEILKDGIHYTQVDKIGENELSNLSEFATKISTIIFPVSKIYIDTHGDVTFSNKDDKNKILFSIETNFDKVWSNVLSAIDTDPLKSKLKDPKQELDYLDARFGNKVFYKFTNGSLETIIKGHDATSTLPTAVPQQ